MFGCFTACSTQDDSDIERLRSGVMPTVDVSRAVTCRGCGTEFGTFTRAVACQLCTTAFCSNCASQTREIPKYNAEEARLCKGCTNQVDAFQTLLKGIRESGSLQSPEQAQDAITGVERLIQTPGFDPEFTTTTEPPLASAVKYGSVQLVSALVAARANVDWSPGGSGSGAFAAAARPSTTGAAPHLCDSLLIRALEHDQWNVAAILLQSGASGRCWKASTQDTALHMAIRGGQSTLVQSLLVSRADPLRANLRGASPLMLATEYAGDDHVDIVKSIEAAIADGSPASPL